MNIQRKNSAHHFRMQSEREETLVTIFCGFKITVNIIKINLLYQFSICVTSDSI